MEKMNTTASLPSTGQGIVLPSEALRKYVKYFWYFCPQFMERTSSQFRIIPSGCPGLIFHHFNGKPSIHLLGGEKYPLAFIHGQDTKSCINEDAATATIISVRLHPSALKTLFNIDAFEVNDKVVPLTDVAGYNLTEQLLNTKDVLEAINLISRFLLKKINQIKSEDYVIDESIAAMMNNISTISPSQLSKRLNISQRQLQRRFKNSIGVCPETYIHILKFQQSINLIQRSYFEKLSDIGYELGYADQPHFIRQFKSLSGLCPKEAYKVLSIPGRGAPQILQNKFKLVRFIYS